MKRIFILLILFSLTSCKTMMIKLMIKNPKVENTNSIKSFQEVNKFSTENSLIIKGDTSNAIENLFLGMAVGYYIFDRDGNQICYNASSTCHGEQFKQLIENKIDSFKSCKNDSTTLQNVLKLTYDLNEKPVNKSQFPNSDYFVVSYWQKFLGGKRGYEEAVNWMEKEIKNNKSNLKFTFIKINTDLQEKWGLIAGKKAKLKMKIKKGHMTMYVKNIPIKR